MIRQPDFVTPDYAMQTIERTMKKKPHPLLEKVAFEEVEDGRCIQMMHLGSFDNEPESFRLMEQFAIDNNLKRKGHTHREIYMSDFRRTAPEKLKTVLRFWVDSKV